MMIIMYKAFSNVKHFDSNKTMSFKASDDKMLKKYTKIWERVSNFILIKFDSESIYGDNDKCINKFIWR